MLGGLTCECFNANLSSTSAVHALNGNKALLLLLF